jgi:PPOX class probable F420-dependent enzyme
MPQELDQARYISFTSYKRNGDPVSLPVWVVSFEGGYAFTTDPDAFKVKRVRNNPRVSLRVCSVRGKVEPGAAEFPGTAEYLDAATADRVNAAIRRKYWFAYRVLIAPSNLWSRIRGGSAAAGHAAIKVMLDA